MKLNSAMQWQMLLRRRVDIGGLYYPGLRERRCGDIFVNDVDLPFFPFLVDENNMLCSIGALFPSSTSNTPGHSSTSKTLLGH